MRVKEQFEDKYIKQFQRIGREGDQVDFTISYLSSYVFKEKKDNSIRGNIKKWKDDGYIINLGRIPISSSKTGWPVNVYGILDVRLARYMTSRISTVEFLQKKVRLCPHCDYVVLRDWEEGESIMICQYCGYDWTTGEAPEYFEPFSDEEIPEDGPQQLEFWSR